ncbi:MAG: 50S ribosomal protein L25 [Acidimicrobiia bacterium]|jgi:large subunit ribosomal protein L25
MPDAVLTTNPRTDTGSRPAGRLRRQGLVPAVVYGLSADTVSVSVDARQLQHILTGASGANTVITLKVAEGDQLALARQIQRHPVKGTLVHVDFVRIRADQTVTAEVPLHLEGESEGVKNGGLLEQMLFTIPVEALPADLPPAIAYDVSALDIGDQVHVRDLVASSAVTITADPDELVVQVVQPRGMDLGEEPEAAEGEEGVEGAEGAEGEAAPAAGASEESGSDEA